MKPIKKFLKKPYPFLLLLVLSLFFYTNSNAQQTPSSDALIGTWTFNLSDSFNQINGEAAVLLAANPQVRQQLEASYAGKQFSFYENGNYTQQLTTGVVIGNWQIDNGKLFLVDTNNIACSYSIKLTGNTIKLTLPERMGEAISIVPVQYFSKI